MSQGWTVYSPTSNNLVTLGDFSAATGWTTPAGWAIGGGVATATAATSALSRNDVSYTAGAWYRLVYTVSGYTAGSVAPVLGGFVGTNRNANGTYTQDFKATTTGTLLQFSATGGSFSIDDVSLVALPYILFNEAPAAGTNNIAVTQVAAASINATSQFRVGAWNTAYGFPCEVEFFADRLCWGGTYSQPQTLWLTRIADYTMFGKSTPVVDDDAITITLNSGRLNAINDFMPKQDLLVMTTGGLWKVGAGTDQPLTPTTVAARPQPSRGASSALQSIDVGETAIYYTYAGTEIRDVSYTFEADGYAGSDLTAFCAHAIRGRNLVAWCWQAAPYSAVTMVRDDGTFLSLTYKREHQVVAMSRCDTQGVVEDTWMVPENGINAVYAIVRRTVGGVEKRYVERFVDDPYDDWREHVGLDCSLTYDGRGKTTGLTFSAFVDVDTAVNVTAASGIFAASNVGDAVVVGYDEAIDRVAFDGSVTAAVEPLVLRIVEYVAANLVRAMPSRPFTETAAASWSLAVDTLSGLAHLEGRTVRVAGDGNDYGTQVVTGGAVTLDPPAALAHVGLDYTCDFESLDLTLLGQSSVATTQKTIKRVGILTENTRLLYVGSSFKKKLSVQEERGLNRPAGCAPPLMDGWQQIDVNDGWGPRPRVCVRCDNPYGATLLAIEPDVSLGK